MTDEAVDAELRAHVADAVLRDVREIAARAGGDGKFVVVRRAMSLAGAAARGAVRERLRGRLAELADDPFFGVLLAEMLAGLEEAEVRSVVEEVLDGGTRSFMQFLAILIVMFGFGVILVKFYSFLKVFDF